MDARYNWWGDSTGPFHSTLNPDGEGDRVGDNVLFDPWYIDSTGSLDSPEQNNFIPEKASLEAYPNPFNLETTLKPSVPNAMIVRVELFDILGRSIKDIWSGPLSYEKEIKFSASGFSSGVYFARAYDTIHNRPVAMTKMLLLK